MFTKSLQIGLLGLFFLLRLPGLGRQLFKAS